MSQIEYEIDKERIQVQRPDFPLFILEFQLVLNIIDFYSKYVIFIGITLSNNNWIARLAIGDPPDRRLSQLYDGKEDTALKNLER